MQGKNETQECDSHTESVIPQPTSPASFTQSQQNLSYHVQGRMPRPSRGLGSVWVCFQWPELRGWGITDIQQVGGQGCLMSKIARRSPVLGRICAAQNAKEASNEKHCKAMKEVLSGRRILLFLSKKEYLSTSMALYRMCSY